MSETVTAPPRSKFRQDGGVDKNAFAQVEKWMALIREIVREQAQG